MVAAEHLDPRTGQVVRVRRQRRDTTPLAPLAIEEAICNVIPSIDAACLVETRPSRPRFSDRLLWHGSSLAPAQAPLPDPLLPGSGADDPLLAVVVTA